jgi:hypothetical protein
MCDEQSLADKYVQFDQPWPQFWHIYYCQGKQMGVRPGNWYSRLPPPQGDYTGAPIGDSDIDTVWVPPNQWVALLGHDKRSRLGPGLYQNLDNDATIGINQAQAMSIGVTKPWLEHLVDCCGRRVDKGASPEKCGRYWGSENGMCDIVVDDYCAKNPEDKMCSCYAIQPDPEDDLATKMLKANPKCWSKDCALYGFKPSSVMSTPCPDVSICRQDVSIPGGQNVLDNNSFLQDCSGNNSNGSGGNTNGTGENGGTTGGTENNKPQSTWSQTFSDVATSFSESTSNLGSKVKDLSTESPMVLFLLFILIVAFGTSFVLLIKYAFSSRKNKKDENPLISPEE